MLAGRCLGPPGITTDKNAASVATSGVLDCRDNDQA
jgi:hypothetical protein